MVATSLSILLFERALVSLLPAAWPDTHLIHFDQEGQCGENALSKDVSTEQVSNPGPFVCESRAFPAIPQYHNSCLFICIGRECIFA